MIQDICKILLLRFPDYTEEEYLAAAMEIMDVHKQFLSSFMGEVDG